MKHDKLLKEIRKICERAWKSTDKHYKDCYRDARFDIDYDHDKDEISVNVCVHVDAQDCTYGLEDLCED